MAEKHPVVYIFIGEDEFAIHAALAGIQAKMGDAVTAEMNTTRLDGRSLSLDALINAVSAMPFLALRRLVIVTNPLAKINSPILREKFLKLLGNVPASTALVLVEYHPLTDYRDRQKQKLHWLEQWALDHEEKALCREFPLPHGDALTRWVTERAKVLGGRFTEEAAVRLVDLVGDEPRGLDQEIQKLLLYVNYKHAVEPGDVEHLTPQSRQGDIFILVDALATGKTRIAQEMLHRLLEEQEALAIFGMVVRQFRLLLQAREVLDRGGREGDVARELKVSAFVAGKLVPQARLFRMEKLVNIYHHLLRMDEAAKTSQVEGDLALEMLVISQG